MQSVFCIPELFNHIFSYVDYFYKIQFSLVSTQCKKWIDCKLLNKKCEDVDEMIRMKKYDDPTYKLIYDEYLKIFNNARMISFLIKNKCFSILKSRINNFQHDVSNNCIVYEVLCMNYCLYECSQSMIFIHDFLKIRPCNSFKCKKCLRSLKMFVKKNLSTPDINMHEIKLLRLSARFGYFENFIKIFDIVQKKLTSEKLLFELNTVLMLAANYKKIIDNSSIIRKSYEKYNNMRIVNQYICKFDNKDLYNSTEYYGQTVPIIKFCIDHGANAYINVGSDCSLDFIYQSNKFETNLINYVVDNCKYFSRSFFRKLLLNAIKYISNINGPTYFYYCDKIFCCEKYIEPTDYFINQLANIRFAQGDKFYCEYLNILNRLITKKIGTVTIDKYFEYLKQISTITEDESDNIHCGPIDSLYILKKIDIFSGILM